jgi:regulatory protein
VKTASLKSRAIRLLARREHSRAELRRKLLGAARDAEVAASVDAVLDVLETENWLSDRRFAELFVRSRAERLGGARLARELFEKGVDRDVANDLLEPLRAAELDRAYALWLGRFGNPPIDRAERGRHGRFLIQRGFSPAIVLQVFDRAVRHESAPDCHG